jgi:hypothetical protein
MKTKKLNSSVTSCDKARRRNRKGEDLLTILERPGWHGMKKFGFGLTGMAWNGGSQFWPDWLRMEEFVFSPD